MAPWLPERKDNKVLTEAIEASFEGHAEDVDDGTAPSLYVITSEVEAILSIVWEELSFEEVLETTVHMNKQWMDELFGELLPHVERLYFWGLSGVDFADASGARPSGAPCVKSLMMVPKSLQVRFEAWLAKQFEIQQHSGCLARLRVTHIENLGSSGEAVELALNHVLAFSRSWPFMLEHVDQFKTHFVTMFTDVS